MALPWCVLPATTQSRMLLAVSAFSTLWLWLLAMPRPSVGMHCGKGSLPTPPSQCSLSRPHGAAPPGLTQKHPSVQMPSTFQKRTEGLTSQCLLGEDPQDCGTQVLMKQDPGSSLSILAPDDYPDRTLGPSPQCLPSWVLRLILTECLFRTQDRLSP